MTCSPPRRFTSSLPQSFHLLQSHLDESKVSVRIINIRSHRFTQPVDKFPLAVHLTTSRQRSKLARLKNGNISEFMSVDVSNMFCIAVETRPSSRNGRFRFPCLFAGLPVANASTQDLRSNLSPVRLLMPWLHLPLPETVARMRPEGCNLVM